jgi:hypothetical protein
VVLKHRLKRSARTVKEQLRQTTLEKRKVEQLRELRKDRKTEKTARARASLAHGLTGHATALTRPLHQCRRREPSPGGGYDPDLQFDRETSESSSKKYLRSLLENLRNDEASGGWYSLLRKRHANFLDRASVVHVLVSTAYGLVFVALHDLDM